MRESLKEHYIDPVRSFNHAARLFLLMIIIDGVILSGWQLFFNIYMLQSGFTREFLGLVNSMPSAAALLFSIPLGRLSDLIGRRLSILIGIAGSSLFMLGQVMLLQPALIAAAGFLYGVSSSLFLVSQAPLMSKLSDRENRTMLFSLSYGLQTISGAIAALFAGQLPAILGTLLHTGGNSATAYQAVLVASIVLGTTSLIPMWFIQEPHERHETIEGSTLNQNAAEHPQPNPVDSHSTLVTLTAKMTAPQILIGFGAAILIPYINVFFKDRFEISDSLLGVLFSLSSLLIGVGSLLGPRISSYLSSKIRAVVITQAASLVFLLLMGFAPVLWLSSVGYLLRTALMNMSSPLYSAFCMERTPERHQGVVNSILTLSWNLGWAVGPFISGLVQGRFGFRPLFIATCVLYGAASLLIWEFFHHTERPEATQAIISSDFSHIE
jgi:MFS family permease